jgi:hypothetical protein
MISQFPFRRDTVSSAGIKVKPIYHTSDEYGMNQRLLSGCYSIRKRLMKENFFK